MGRTVYSDPVLMDTSRITVEPMLDRKKCSAQFPEPTSVNTTWRNPDHVAIAVASAERGSGGHPLRVGRNSVHCEEHVSAQIALEAVDIRMRMVDDCLSGPKQKKLHLKRGLSKNRETHAGGNRKNARVLGELETTVDMLPIPGSEVHERIPLHCS